MLILTSNTGLIQGSFYVQPKKKSTAPGISFIIPIHLHILPFDLLNIGNLMTPGHKVLPFGGTLPELNITPVRKPTIPKGKDRLLTIYFAGVNSLLVSGKAVQID